MALASASNDGGIDAHAVVPGGRLRERLHRARARRSPGRLRGLLRRHDHALRPPHGPGARRHRLAREPDGLGRGGHEVPLPVDVPHRVLAARPQASSTRAATASSARTDEGQSWEAISGDLTRTTRAKLGSVGRTDHQGQHQRRVLRHGLRDGGVAAREGRDLGRLRRRARARLARRRQDAGRTSPPREMPEWSLVSQIDVSAARRGTVYLATTRYKLDDFKPYAWVTTRLRQDLAEASRAASPRRRSCASCGRIPRGAGCCTRERRRASTCRSTTARAGSRCAWRCRARPGRRSVARAFTSAARAHGGHASRGLVARARRHRSGDAGGHSDRGADRRLHAEVSCPSCPSPTSS